jgi:hypothetical protein
MNTETRSGLAPHKTGTVGSLRPWRTHSRRSRLVLGFVALLAVFGLMPSSAQAITNGQYDGANHPYVGYADNWTWACSGALLSPTVMLTAAHCFSDSVSAFGTNTVTGAPLVRVSFQPDLVNLPGPQHHFNVGSYYFDPQFAKGKGTADFATHDVAVIIFTQQGCTVPTSQIGVTPVANYSCGPVPADATNGQYASLPSQGVVDTLAMGANIDVVGYGAQNFTSGGGPCAVNCMPQVNDTATRFFASTTFIASKDVISGEFVKLHSNNGGICYGDSGGPDLLGGTNITIGVNSFGSSIFCSGSTYSDRTDTAATLNWIRTTVTAHGAGL